MTHVPSPGATWQEIWRFALSLDASERDGDFEPLARLANDAARNWAADASLPDDLGDAEAALFFEQRRYHHVGDDPQGEDARYLRALVARIGELTAARTRDGAPSGTSQQGPPIALADGGPREPVEMDHRCPIGAVPPKADDRRG